MSDLTVMGWLYWAYCIVAILLLVKVVLNNRDTFKTLAWIMVLVFLPGLGMVLYFFFGRDTRKNRLISKRQLSQIQQRNQLQNSADALPDIPQEYSSLASFFDNVSSSRPLCASGVEIIDSTERFASLLLEQVAAAKEHIHMQFYIFENDEFGRALRDALVAKAKEGVEVRVIYDSVGCLAVDKGFFEGMRCAGIYVESFMKVRFPLFTRRVNYRNHRKVVVIDGNVGFVGGCNIADRYLKGINGGVWRDTMMLLRGAAVHGLQSAFLQDWYFANRTLVSGKRYFPLQPGGDVAVQTVLSNPVGNVRTIMNGMLKAIHSARRCVYLQSPYFMPNEAFVTALKCAALSGVDVRLMIPMRSDSRVADYASRSYLSPLLDAGVKVYLYKDGFLHSKTMMCDERLSSIGSVNLDFRSFYYNFEISAFVYGKSVAQELKSQFMRDAGHCHQLAQNEFRARPFVKRCAESVVRLFSPLL